LLSVNGDFLLLTVIFGAGTSYDSVPARPSNNGVAYPFRPPLANDLFADRELFADTLALFERIVPIVPRLRHLRGKSIESVLREIQDEAVQNPVRYQQLMAVRYYIECMLWECEHHWEAEAKGVTNYKSLLDEIAHWRKNREPVCLITFNYDTLLEDALPVVGPPITKLEDYVFGNPEFRVFKLHGSINWARTLRESGRYGDHNAWAVARQHIDRAAELRIGDFFVRVEDRPVGLTATQVPLVPAIAIPVEQKNHFECPSDHLRILEELLPHTDRLILIGWRATEDHFLDLLTKHVKNARLGLAVSGSEAEARQAIARIDGALTGKPIR
jgi:SIR2-like domain